MSCPGTSCFLALKRQLIYARKLQVYNLSHLHAVVRLQPAVCMYKHMHHRQCARIVTSVTTCLQVMKALESYGGKLESEEELKPVEKLMSEAYQEIDKAVVKGIIKQNTAARRKSRLAVAKRKLLITAGLYTPAPQTA